jgi:hypothetical protein
MTFYHVPSLRWREWFRGFYFLGVRLFLYSGTKIIIADAVIEKITMKSIFSLYSSIM